MSDGAAALIRALGDRPADSVLALPSEVLEHLADQIEKARRHQIDVMAESVRVAVKGVPLPVRGIVRKVLLG
jgi:ubiquinone biosynthesis protein UbiJ